MTKKHKDKFSFEKRQYRGRAVGHILPTMMKRLGGGQSESGALIVKIISHWNAIAGEDLAAYTRPDKIVAKKRKNRTSGEQITVYDLKVLCEGAFGTLLAMRQHIVLERLNRLLGTDRFQILTVTHGHIAPQSNPARRARTPRHEGDAAVPLNLPPIDDPVLKSRLESLAQAVMNSAR